MKIPPDMGHITIDPRILLNYIYSGGWIYEKIKTNTTFAIYNGTRDGLLFSSNFIEKSLVGTLMIYKFITVDSGNWDYRETFYRFNPDYDQKNNKELLNVLINQIKNNNFKTKYKQLIRLHKLERVLK